MTQQSLVYTDGQTCRWCFIAAATTTLYGTPTCIGCAAGSAKDRVTKWLQHVAKKAQG